MKSSILKASLLVLILSLIGRATGFGREVAIAATFGTTVSADALIVGLTPLMVFTGVFGSAYTTAAMVHIKDPSDSSKIRSTLAPLILFAAFVSLITFLFSTSIIELFSPDLDEESKRLAIICAKFTSPAIFLNSIAAWSIGLSQLRHRFLLPAIAVILPNVGLVVGVLISFRILGVNYLALTIFLGYLAQLLFVLHLQDYKIELADFSNLFSDGSRKLYKSFVFTILTTSVVYVDLTVDRIIASNFLDGSVAALNYASKLISLPNYTIIFAIITVMFPRLIQLGDNDPSRFDLERKVVATTLLIALTVTCITWLLSDVIVRSVLEYGAFDTESSQVTAQLLRYYAIGFTGFAFTLVGVRLCFARSDFVTPVFAGIAALATKLIFNFTLIGHFEASGLAIATAIAAWVNGVILVSKILIDGKVR